ncbi:MAG: alpha/beta hydrolase [Planctomycetes bacterium]|nr:alpha/beta hydrolase [Planctomycetota bacterium]
MKALTLTILLGLALTPSQDSKKEKKKKNPAALSFAGAATETYKEASGSRLKLYLFRPEGHQAGDKRPAIVFFFGGGWNGGSPKQFEPHARYLARRGMVAIVADYRVKSRQKTSPFECVKDGKSAVRWLRKNSERLGIDPSRLAAGGGSAGGHVAAATGTVPGLEEDGEDTSVSSLPNALVLFNPVFDNGPMGYGHSRVKDRFREISPIHNLSKKTPPTIVFLGTKDKLVPVSTAQRYKKLMEKSGGRCDLHLYKDQPHGFFNGPDRGGAFNPYYLKTVTAMDRFLASLGYLKGEPTIRRPD